MIGPQFPGRTASMRSRIASPPMRMSALSPPPMRRASPPANTSPTVRGCSVIVHGGLAAMLGAFLVHVGEILIEHDPALAGERDEALAAGASDQREVRLAGELNAPGG